MTFEDTLRQLIREEICAALRDMAPTVEMLSIEESAALAKVSRTTMQRYLKDGVLVRHGKGKLTRVRRADVLALLDNGLPPVKPAAESWLVREQRKAG